MMPWPLHCKIREEPIHQKKETSPSITVPEHCFKNQSIWPCTMTLYYDLDVSMWLCSPFWRTHDHNPFAFITTTHQKNIFLFTRPQVFQTGRLSFPPRVSSLCRILYSPFSFDPQSGRFVSSIFICPSVAALGYLVGVYPRWASRPGCLGWTLPLSCILGCGWPG